MGLELVSFTATDKVLLSGLLYTPKPEAKKAAIWLHGMGDGSVFYSTVISNALGEELTDRNIAVLVFNNRGAGYSKKLHLEDDTLPEEDRAYQAGTHFEIITDCVADIDGAVNFLKQKGYDEFYLIGHSTGANKICAYHVRAAENPFSKYVLAGPGDDSGLFYNELGEKKFKLALSYAKWALKRNQQFKIMPKYTGMNPFSAQAAKDILDPEGAYSTFPFYEATTRRLGNKPLFKEYKQINIPALVIFGENDEYTYTAGGTMKALDLFKLYTNKTIMGASAFQTIEGADHSFHGYEKHFASAVADWLDK